jgi:5-hydroxyisourate hydrolase
MTSTRDTSTLSTHVLDTSFGVPARGLRVVRTGVTDAEGRLRDVAGADGALSKGVYRLRFDTGHYFAHHERATLYPEVAIVIRIDGDAQHYHVPLLLSAYGYTTYRGT